MSDNVCNHTEITVKNDTVATDFELSNGRLLMTSSNDNLCDKSILQNLMVTIA